MNISNEHTRESGGSIIRDGLRLISSSVVAQVVALLLLTVVGRQYDEDTMGVLGSFLSWGGLLSIVACGRYEQGIVVAPSDDDARILYCLSLRIAWMLTLVLTPVVLIWGSVAPSSTPLGWTLFLLPLYVLLLAWYNASAQWLLRQQQYSRLAGMQLMQGGGNNLLKVVLGFWSATSISLVGAQLLALLGSYSLFGRSLRMGLRRPQGLSVGLREVAWRYQGFPRYGLIQALINTLLGSLLVLLLPLRFGTAEVGFLTMAIMLARRPLQLIGDNLGSVYLQRMSTYVASGMSLLPLVRRLIVMVLLLGVPGAVILWFCMDSLVEWIVGPRWGWSAYIIVWMLPMCVVTFLTSILNVLPDIFSRQRSNMWAQVMMLLFDVVVIGVGFWLFDFERFIPYFYLLMLVEQMVYLIYLLLFVSRYERRRSSIL